jgi:D-threonate/D-erythronate kinase
MIAVIADDLTGAAEIAGIALRHGFRVVMDTKVHPNVDADILVIATDSRSKSPDEAKELMRTVTASLLELKPQLIFKKTDSLLRGHVGDELTAQMITSGKKRTLLIPANPALKRTIRNGIYYADNVPLNESWLADASRNKIATSEVLALVGEQFRESATVISIEEMLPDKGVIIGNTITEGDLDSWAQKIDADTIPAGSGGFFDAIIKRKVSTAAQNNNYGLNGTKRIIKNGAKRIIYVCGSAFSQSKANVKQARAEGRHVSYMPEEIFSRNYSQEEIIDKWAADIIKGLQQYNNVIIAVDHLVYIDAVQLPAQIRLMMALVIQKIMQLVAVDELVVEGGATASSIIESLKYERFFPVQEVALGVIRMKVQENPRLFLTLKPGSYHWPSSIWNQEEFV